MRPVVLLDTGPLVAFLDESEPDHAWARQEFAAHPLPFLTCDAVLSEAAFLLLRGKVSLNPFFELILSGSVRPAFDVRLHAAALKTLMAKYSDLPMDFADACLVRMAELHPAASVLTVDGDFYVYRKHGRVAIPVLAP